MAEYPALDDINARLKDIVSQVEDPNLPIDELLTLFEEAVKLGGKAGDMVEANISEADAQAAYEAVSAPAEKDAEA